MRNVLSTLIQCQFAIWVGTGLIMNVYILKIYLIQIVAFKGTRRLKKERMMEMRRKSTDIVLKLFLILFFGLQTF